jgi:hypothetical protein
MLNSLPPSTHMHNTRIHPSEPGLRAVLAPFGTIHSVTINAVARYVAVALFGSRGRMVEEAHRCSACLLGTVEEHARAAYHSKRAPTNMSQPAATTDF